LLDQALANLEEQERELKRVQLLAAKRSVPESELDSRQTQVVIARQKVKEARATLADLTLRAPFDGLLGLKKISPGALVSPGTVITTLDQLERIKLDFSVPAIFAAELKPGLPISATSPALPGFHFEGIVHSVDARIDTNSRSVLARAELNNADEMIRPGMLMHISLRRNPRQALTLPESAIVSRQTRHFVWRVNADNQVNLVAVSLGTRRAGRVEVKNGLVPDDQVVIDGVHRISEGQTIAVAEPPALARQ
jgi:membrane fusion protein (multidrug efflux system)